MERRPRGRTGVSVSKLCLGAMMFGNSGNKDHDDSIRIIHRALDARINFIDTADRKRLADLYDPSLPANERKLDRADQLAQLAEEPGMSLIEMAIAFVINHPAVTGAISGPRTMEQLESQLPAADITLSGDVLDRIDNRHPHTNINPANGGWVSPALQPTARRR